MYLNIHYEFRIKAPVKYLQLISSPFAHLSVDGVLISSVLVYSQGVERQKKQAKETFTDEKDWERKLAKSEHYISIFASSECLFALHSASLEGKSSKKKAECLFNVIEIDCLIKGKNWHKPKYDKRHFFPAKYSCSGWNEANAIYSYYCSFSLDHSLPQWNAIYQITRKKIEQNKRSTLEFYWPHSKHSI